MTHKLVIDGGRRLEGRVRISGAKNSVLKLMAAAILTAKPVHITNVPGLADVDVMSDVLKHLGVYVERSGQGMMIQAESVNGKSAPYELVSKMRASFNVLGSLLGRFGEARVSLPGGCSIGKRGIDLHIKGLQALGADVEIVHGFVEAKAERLVGADIVLDMPSVGATENIMVAAVLAEGTTRLSNAAQEPEIIDLANFMNAMGADIHGAGTNEIVIHGVTQDKLTGVEMYSVVPDRVEAATYLMAAAATRGDVTVTHVVPSHLSAVLSKLTEMGAVIDYPDANSIHLLVDKRLEGKNIVTLPYPGFPTDLQAPGMVLQSISEGSSTVRETIYENRFMHVGELSRMGANIQQDGNMVVVTGVERLSGAEVKACDLRAAAAMIIAGLHAEGVTEILSLHHLDRGYECLEEKMRGLGASIRRVLIEEVSSSEESISNPECCEK